MNNPSRSHLLYLNSNGISFPKKGNFFFLRSIFSIRRIMEYCFKSSFTSFSFVPEPLATRFILAELKNAPMSGYDVIAYIHNKFGILVSSGTVYSLLYSLERDNLIRGIWAKRKRVYELTEKGERSIEAILNANDKIKSSKFKTGAFCHWEFVF